MDIATVTHMIIQGRHSSDEAVENLKVNISLTGEEWISIGFLDLEHDDYYNGFIAELIPAVNTKIIRLIPVTDRAMPICIRTEFFGCYRTDNFRGYSLSTPPQKETPEFGLDSLLTGFGKLVDGVLDEFINFDKKLEVKMNWSKAVNISEVVIRTSQRPGSCLTGIVIKTGMNNYRYSKIPCATGVTDIPLLLDQIVHEIVIIFEHSGIFKISEISWTDTAELTAIRMDTIESSTFEAPQEVPVSKVVADWLPLAAIVFGAVVIIIVIFTCVCMLRKRFRMKPKFSHYEPSTAHTTLRLIPSRANSSTTNTNNSYLSRNDMIVRSAPPPTRNISQASHITSKSFQNGYFYAENSPNKEFGNEYSEIGSITADSGHGESLEGDKPSYAEINVV
jgi:hypothetical protein